MTSIKLRFFHTNLFKMVNGIAYNLCIEIDEHFKEIEHWTKVETEAV